MQDSIPRSYFRSFAGQSHANDGFGWCCCCDRATQYGHQIRLPLMTVCCDASDVANVQLVRTLPTHPKRQSIRFDANESSKYRRLRVFLCRWPLGFRSILDGHLIEQQLLRLRRPHYDANVRRAIAYDWRVSSEHYRLDRGRSRWVLWLANESPPPHSHDSMRPTSAPFGARSARAAMVRFSVLLKVD